MTQLLMPAHTFNAVQKQKREARDKAMADNIGRTSMNHLTSDDFVTAASVEKQLAELGSYIEERRQVDPGYTLPKAVGWRLLVLILTSPKETDGGVHLVDEALEAKSMTSPQGIVLDVGPAAYQDRTRFAWGGELEPWCGIGDRIVWKRYDLTMFQIANGQRLGFMNDTQPVATIDQGWTIPN